MPVLVDIKKPLVNLRYSVHLYFCNVGEGAVICLCDLKKIELKYMYIYTVLYNVGFTRRRSCHVFFQHRNSVTFHSAAASLIHSFLNCTSEHEDLICFMTVSKRILNRKGKLILLETFLLSGISFNC